MNNLVKAGVGAALAFGAVAAHASIVGGSSSGTLGNAILFADVYKGSTFVEAYAGDTQISVSSIGGGTVPSTFSDANLQNFLTTYATAGTTVYWVVEGGGDNKSGATKSPYFVTSAPSLSSLGTALNGNSLNTAGISFNEQQGTINTDLAPGATSLITTDNTVLSGTGFAPLGQPSSGDASNWFNLTSLVSSTGLNSSATMYLLSAANTSGSTKVTPGALFNVSLTSAGLTFSPLTAVPIPAALWLLGSGLLGLAGVARRKVAAA